MKNVCLFLCATLLLITSCRKHRRESLAVVQTLPVVVKANLAESGGIITDDDNSIISQRGICWAEKSGPTINDSITNDGTGDGSFTSIITGLKANTTYYVRAYAINAAGTAYGNEVEFTSGETSENTDIDGNQYTYSVYCGKVFMNQNLKTTRYRNGDPIVNGLTGFNWATSTTGAYTFPDGNVQYKDSIGLYYNLSAVNDARGVCPAGWHVATDEDWKAMEICTGMTAADADKTGPRSAYTFGLIQKFSYAGYFDNNDSTFNKSGEEAVYWTSTKEGDVGNWTRRAPFDNGPYPYIYRNIVKDSSLAIRCVRDEDYEE